MASPDIAAHEQTDTFVEHDLLPEHGRRAGESTTFDHAKAILVALAHGRCWLDTDLCDYVKPIEAHHIHEWAEWEKMDPIRVKLTLLQFDPYGFSAKMAIDPAQVAIINEIFDNRP